MSDDDKITITWAGDTSNAYEYTSTSPYDINMSTLSTISNDGTFTSGNVVNPTWITNTTIGATGSNYQFSNVTQSAQLNLIGDNADIVVNGVSLMDKINAIGERLNMLDINPELEAEWDQLRELGDCYRQLEQELKTKSAMWKTLKTKTPSKPRS